MGDLHLFTTLVDGDADLDSMVTHFKKAVTDTTAELLGKQRRKRKPWVTPEILDLCDQRRDLNKKRGEPEILNRWTVYYSDLYNYETDRDQIALDCPQIPDE